MTITKREKIILASAGIILIAFFLFPQLLDPDYEILYLLLIVVPLGALIATDKERTSKP